MTHETTVYFLMTLLICVDKPLTNVTAHDILTQLKKQELSIYRKANLTVPCLSYKNNFYQHVNTKWNTNTNISPKNLLVSSNRYTKIRILLRLEYTFF